MLDKSRSDIYDYLYRLFFGAVTENVYSMSVPQELEETDKKDGFIVLHVGEIYDDSEFSGQAYGWVRCFVDAFVPPITRGRLDVEKYGEFERGITSVIEGAVRARKNSDKYFIQEDSIVSSDEDEISNANNTFFEFIKSFVVLIDNNSNS